MNAFIRLFSTVVSVRYFQNGQIETIVSDSSEKIAVIRRRRLSLSCYHWMSLHLYIAQWVQRTIPPCFTTSAKESRLKMIYL